MSNCIRVGEHGGPEVLKFEPHEVGAPGPKEARVRQTAIGLNYIDIYFRTGLYPPPNLPFIPGMEGAGVVEAIGDSVTEVEVGQRVGYAGALGAYAEVRLLPAARLVPLSGSVSDEQAAAMMLKGMTAQYLLRQTYRVKAGETILWHAAAGGVGLIACQWAKHLGVMVIGTVGSEEKADLARRNGCEHVILYREENFVDRVREITGGEGVPVVYDSVGKATFMQSLDCLKPRGLMVSFGNASGAVDAFNLGTLSQKGSLYVTRPTLVNYTSQRSDLLECAGELMDVVGSRAVNISINQNFALKDAAEAHKALEGRATTGST
ncbi:MAG: quinone oxidoreductase, partial [Pseudomonadota bacterium]